MTTKEPAEPVAATDSFVCPCCGKELTAEANRWKASQMGKKGGSARSEKKAAAARLNAKKPRPRKPKPDTNAETQS